MANLTKTIRYFNNVWPLLVLLWLNFGCSESSKNFTNFLYDLAEVNVDKRAAYLDDWLKKQEEFPIIDGHDVYFIFKEKHEVAVFLAGDLIAENSSYIQLMKIIGTDYYYCKQSYPLDSGIEYKFIVNGRHFLDPLNKRIIKTNTELRSLLFMPEYNYPVETLTRINKVYTKVDTLSFDKNAVYVYRHPKAVENSPLIIFLNGNEYLEYAEANIILDNLTFAEEIVPCFAAFPSAKVDAKTLFFFIKKELNLKNNLAIIGGNRDAGRWIFQNPQIFGTFDAVFIQSGFTYNDSLTFLSQLQDVDLSDKKIFLSYGLFEKQDSVYSKIISFCESKTTHFDYKKYNEGASWLSWKGHLDDALVYLTKKDRSTNF